MTVLQKRTLRNATAALIAHNATSLPRKTSVKKIYKRQQSVLLNWPGWKMQMSSKIADCG